MKTDEPLSDVDPIDVHLAASGPPLMKEEARERISVAHGVEPDDDDDDELLDEEDDDDDDDDFITDEEIEEVRSKRDSFESDAAHVVVHSTANGKAAGGKCQPCGAVLTVTLPCNLSDWCAATQAFADKHAKCRPAKSRKKKADT